MENQNKVFVFDRLELGILVLFFLVLAVTSFVLGARFGKKEAMQAYVKSQSNQFKVNDIAANNTQPKISQEKKLNDEIKMTLAQRLREAEIKKKATTELDIEKRNNKTQEVLNKLSNKVRELGEVPATEVSEVKTAEVEKIIDDKVNGISTADIIADKVKTRIDNEVVSVTSDPGYSLVTDDLIGKYTIQLGSYKSMNEAQEFAEDFIARNYRPIINEVNLPGRGQWFRVSLGIFDSQISAIRYVKRESALFDSKQYYVTLIE